MTTICLRHNAPGRALATAGAILMSAAISLIATAETLSREADMAVRHVQNVLPGVLARCDEALRRAMDEADRAQRGVIAQSSPASRSAAVSVDERGEFMYADNEARGDMIMSCEYAVALCSRRLDLVEAGLCFESLPQDVRSWRVGDVGLLYVAGEFDDAHDRLAHVTQVLGPKRMLVTTTIVGVDQKAGDVIILDGVPTEGLAPGDAAPLGRDPFAVAGSETRISTQTSQSIPILRPVPLSRYGGAIAQAGIRSVKQYRAQNPRPTR